MAHKSTLRLTDETWEKLEQVLAANGITATAFFEASAHYCGEIGAANPGKHHELWDLPEDQKQGWRDFFATALEIDRARRSRSPRRADDDS